MAYKLKLPTSGYITIPTWSVSAGQDFVIEIIFDTPTALGTDGIIGNATGESFFAVFSDRSVETKLANVKLHGSNNDGTNGNVFTANNKFKWRVERVSNICSVTITNLTTSTVTRSVSGVSFSSGFSFTFLGNTQGLIFNGGSFYTAELATGGVTRYYDANASGGTGTILPETNNSANNGSQAGTWPSDDSEWVFYSSGSNTESIISYDIGAIDYAISSTVAAPNTTAAIAYDIGAITFAASSIVSAPATTATINYDIGAVNFATSATVGVKSTAAFDIGSIDYSISVGATSNASAAIAFDIGEINFDLSALVVSNISTTISYDIGSIDFAVYCTIPTNEPERSLMTKDNVFWRNSIFFKSGRT